MKNMKKLLALMLALSMLTLLAACGSGPRGSLSTPADSGSAAPESAPEPNPETQDGLQPGSTVGGVYENAFAGIGCRLDETWTYLSDEEILAQNEIVIDSIDDEELARLLSSKSTFFDMLATSEEGLATVNVVAENLGLLYGSVLDTGSYVDIALKSFESNSASMGLTVSSCEKRSFDFCGKSTDGISLSGTINIEGVDVEMFERIACVKAGSYMFVVTACTYVEDNTEDVLNLFYAL